MAPSIWLLQRNAKNMAIQIKLSLCHCGGPPTQKTWSRLELACAFTGCSLTRSTAILISLFLGMAVAKWLAGLLYLTRAFPDQRGWIVSKHLQMQTAYGGTESKLPKAFSVTSAQCRDNGATLRLYLIRRISAQLFFRWVRSYKRKGGLGRRSDAGDYN